MDTDRTDQIRPFIVICEDRTAVTIAAKRLGREERSGRNITETAGQFAIDGSAESLGAVFQ